MDYTQNLDGSRAMERATGGFAINAGLRAGIDE
jgi:hypothetical protein